MEHLKFTFGIITSPNTCCFLQQIVDDIRRLNIPEYEILIIGGNVEINDSNLRVIPFDESQKYMWITRKKNLLTQYAKYENIVYLHDYYSFCPDWYEGFCKFGSEFKVCMTKIINLDGSRFRDWTLWPADVEPTIPNREFFLPYDVTHLSRYMYISGGYWVAKKSFMEKYPLNENLIWGQAEDIEWSYQVKRDHEFSINPNSTAKLLKYKDKAFNYMSESTVQLLSKLK